MNKKIILSVFIAGIITFCSLSVLNYSFPHASSENHEFYSEKLDPNLNNTFIFGSSHVGTLDIEKINKIITQKNESYRTYNLAYATDYPSIRYNTIQEIIALKPSLVFYGISERDFRTTEINEMKIDFNFLKNNFLFDDLLRDGFNPQFMIIDSVKRTLVEGDFTEGTGIQYSSYAPFWGFSKNQMIIISEAELKRQATYFDYPEILENDVSQNKQVRYLKKIINELQNENIKVIIFKTPMPKSYLENLPTSTIEKYDEILNEISNEFNIKVYDFSEKYTELPIWMDLTHVAFNANSSIYSEDVATMIISGIEV
jgi:hypothetical protein